MKLYDRAADRGDPFEECMKLAIRGILVSPDFLFRLETPPSGPEVQPISDHELATRLSYFLWASMPDAELTRLADAGQLSNDDVLRQQTRRLLKDPRSLVFARDFIGQWLGTKDVGGRVAPTVAETKEFYTPEIAADMREEPIRVFHHIISENRSVLELIDSDYTFASKRLAKFYGLDKAVASVPSNDLAYVKFPDKRRGGVLGMSGVLRLTSHGKRTSPVLRGAWVFDTLFGTPVPPPPADVPPLKKTVKGKKLTMKEQLAKHRDHKNCLACHRIIDPIGFGLENFDAFGRWRDKVDGKPVDAKGEMPSGETFDGPAELRAILMDHKTDITRQLVRKVMGYGLGRSLTDWDDCTIAELQQTLATNDYKAVPLIEALVLSTPFRNRQVTTE
jgi:hypothetical protein